MCDFRKEKLRVGHQGGFDGVCTLLLEEIKGAIGTESESYKEVAKKLEIIEEEQRSSKVVDSSVLRSAEDRLRNAEQAAVGLQAKEAQNTSEDF